MAAQNSRCDQAIQYVQRYGFSPIPTSRDKIPYVKWAPFRSQRPTIYDIKRWWLRWPLANIAIVSGPISKLMVLDLDNQEAIDQVTALGLPDTTRVWTNRGMHIWFEYPEFNVGCRKLFGNDSHVEIKGDGGLITAPPSIHKSGKVYQFENDQLTSITPAPAWLLAELRPKKRVTLRGQQPFPMGNDRRSMNYATRALEAELNRIHTAVKDGRNNTLNRAAFSLGQLVAAGMLDASGVADQLYDAAIDTGLSDYEARKTIASGLKAGINKPRSMGQKAGQWTRQ